METVHSSSLSQDPNSGYQAYTSHPQLRYPKQDADASTHPTQKQHKTLAGKMADIDLFSVLARTKQTLFADPKPHTREKREKKRKGRVRDPNAPTRNIDP